MKRIFKGLLLVITSLSLVACSSNKKTGDIKVYTRDTTSGARGAFFEIIELKDLSDSNKNMPKGYVEVTSNGDMMSSLNNDVNGIGYISLAGLKTSGLKGLVYNGAKPTTENVVNGEYSLKRPFMYIRKNESHINSEIEKILLNAFIAFVNSKEGKEIIINNGGIIEDIEGALEWNTIKKDHDVAFHQGGQVEIHFGGSTSVEKIARALSSVFQTIAPRFKPMHSHTGSGAAFTGTKENGSLHLGFISRDLKEDEKLTADYRQIAWDAVVVVVNKKNGLNEITTAEIKKIFAGNIKDWEDLLN